MFSYVFGLKACSCCGKYHSTAWYMNLPPQLPRSKATTVADSSVPWATDWFGPTYSAVPVAVAWAPPHDDHTTLVTRPLGSPPLKILPGLTCPNPCPWAKSPASWPSVGTPAGLADGDAEAGTGAVPGETGGWLSAGAPGTDRRRPARRGRPARSRHLRVPRRTARPHPRHPRTPPWTARPRPRNSSGRAAHSNLAAQDSFHPASGVPLFAGAAILPESADQAEERADLIYEKIRRLKGREMAAPGRFTPVADVRETPLRPPPGRPLKISRETRAADRDGDRVGRSPADPVVHPADALPVQPRGRGASPRQPVEHEVVEQFIPGKHVLQMPAVVGPGPVLLDDPRAQRGR